MTSWVRIGRAASLAGLLAGCTVTSQVPLAKHVWQIQTDSSGHTAALTSEATPKRAAELTAAQGYDRFVIRNPQTLITEGANHVSVDVVMFHAGDPQAAQAIDAARRRPSGAAMPPPPVDPDDAPSAEDEDLTVGEARARDAAIEALREAFPVRRPRRFDPFVDSRRGGEPADVEEILGPVEDWTAVDVEALDERRHIVTSALAFLSDDALCFYPPAFLIAGLKGRCVMRPPSF